MYLFICLLMTGALMCAALYGKKPGWAVIALLIAMQASAWAFCHMNRKNDILSRKKKFGFSRAQGIRTGSGLFLVFLCASAVIFFKPVFFYDIVYQVEGAAVRFFRQITGSGRDPVAEGAINRGNNYRSGTVQLEVTASEEPTQALYLKGFCGGVYDNSRWEEADEEAALREASQSMGWDDWYSMVEGMHYTMYFMLNRGTVRENAPQPVTLSIRHRSGDYSHTFTPYYSRSGRIGQAAEEEIITDGYVCQYYELNNVEIAWDERSNVREKVKEWYQWLQDAYAEEARTVFTQVPEDQLPGLTRLVKENPQNDLGGITAFVCSVLQDHVDYTLTPGRAPIDQDIVEYFFFESGQGYCQHYASAATLLYRLYGIPARYVSGYVIQPSDFEEQGDGIWTADVTDESAHAWVEILLDDYGWMPVEVTPDSEGSIKMPFQEYESAGLRQIMAETSDSNVFGERQNDGRVRRKEKLEEGYFRLFDLEKYRDVFPVLCACLFCWVLFFPIWLDYRRLCRRYQLEQMGCRRIFSIMMDMFHHAGYFPETAGWEKDFPSKVSKEFPQVTEEEMLKVQNIVKKAAYGPAGADAEEEQFVRWIYFRLEEQMFQKMKGYRKLVFRYGRR